MPRHRGCETRSAYCGLLLRNHSHRGANVRHALERDSGADVVAHIGSRPTIDRTAQGMRRRPSGPQHVVVEAVLLVPQPAVVHRRRDVGEVLEELRGQVGVRLSCAASRIAISRRLRQNSAIHDVPSDCSSMPPSGSWADRSIGPMLSSPRKPPSNTLLPLASLRFTHQVKFSSSLWRTRSRKSKSRAAVDLEDAQRRPGVHRRVDVAERPLVGGQLAVRVHVPLAAQQDELLLGEGRVDVGERDALEGEVPGRVPRVLPRVGHRDDVAVVEVAPRRRCGRRRGSPAGGGPAGSPSSQRSTS